eukprot:s53_g22.t1
MARGRMRQGLVAAGGARERMAKRKGKKLGNAIAEAAQAAQTGPSAAEMKSLLGSRRSSLVSCAVLVLSASQCFVLPGMERRKSSARAAGGSPEPEAHMKFALGVEMLMETAANYSNHGQHEKALTTLGSAEQFLEAAGYPDSLAAGYFIQHGSAFANLKRFGEALQEFGKARAIFKMLGRDPLKDEATVVEKASEGLDVRGDEPAKARILSSMGAACVGSGAVEEGLSHMKQAWQALLRAKLGDTPEGAMLLSQMGSANISFELARDRYLVHGNFMEALRMWYLSMVSNVRGWLWDTEQQSTADQHRSAGLVAALHPMEDWDPFADPADTGAEITKCVVEERDAKSIFNTRWADKAQNEALMAALLTSSMDEPTIREQEQEDSLDHGVADPPGRPGGEAKLVETQTDSPEKRQSSKPPVTGEISEAPEPRPRGRIGYQSQSKGNGKGVGGYTAWLSALDRPKPPIQETQSAQSEAPSLPGGQGAEAAEATKSTKAAVPVDAPKVEETRIMCEVDPDEMLAWRVQNLYSATPASHMSGMAFGSAAIQNGLKLGFD